MTRDEMIHQPQETGPVRLIGPVDVDSLVVSLKTYIEQQVSDRNQIVLRKPDDWDGIGELRESGRILNAELLMSFRNWLPNTEVLQNVAKMLGIRDFGRVRLLMLGPRSNYSFHHDPDSWRVHIPVVTNENAFMIVHGKLWHLPLGNAYLVKVKDHHCAMNAGNEDRIHIVFDWCDNLE